MVKITFGLCVVALILYIIYQIRKEGEKFEHVKEEAEELENLQKKLNAMDFKDEVVEKSLELQKREKQLAKKKSKLDSE